MALSPQTWRTATKWKQLLHYEVISSWTTSEQCKVLLTVSELLNEGFSLPDTMDFLMAIYPKHKTTFEAMQEELAAGEAFYQCVRHLRVTPTIQYQLKVAELWGDFEAGLRHVSIYLQQQAEHRRKLKQTLTYPLFLCVLVLGLLFGLRYFLLPQLQRMSSNTAPFVFLSFLFWSLEHLPLLLLGFVALIGIGILLFREYQTRTSPLYWRQQLVKIPVIGSMLRLYYTYYFAYEFSQLFHLGYSVQQITSEFKQQTEVVFLQEFGHYLSEQYEQGQAFTESLGAVELFTPEFPAIVLQGEHVNALAVKMRLYSERCYSALTERMYRMIHWIENGLFVCIALIVVFVYLLLMLPMFSMIGGLES
ncbi:MAG: competence type IV pilus assembly protein ComGB [Aerococcus sp.]|nr:competence type IV pilus assembly protein ComGB [Aerococcus sp.]